MTLEFDRNDLLSLIKGVNPHYSLFDDPVVKACGSYDGSYDTWHWSPSSLNELNELQLWYLYKSCVESWKR